MEFKDVKDVVKALRIICANLPDSSLSSEENLGLKFREAFMQVPYVERAAIYNALYPYTEARVSVICPHCGARAAVDATTTATSTANGYWAVVATDDRLYLDWNDDYEVEVTGLEYLCPHCARQIAGSLDELEDLWKDQQKQTTNEELGILGK